MTIDPRPMTLACSLRKAEPGVGPPYVGTRATEEKEIGKSEAC
jgi:hypothetical protein